MLLHQGRLGSVVRMTSDLLLDVPDHPDSLRSERFEDVRAMDISKLWCDVEYVRDWQEQEPQYSVYSEPIRLAIVPRLV